MSSTRVNDGIHGALSYKPPIIEEIKRERKKFMEKFPVSEVIIYLADRSDERWNGKKEKENCEGCDVFIAGYKTEALCKNCKTDEK